MKGVSRNKFLLCCRPVVDMDVRKRSVGRALTYISAGNSKDVDGDNMKLPAAKSGGGCSADSQEPVPSPPKRTLSRVIRAVMFEIILSKGVREKKGMRSSQSMRSEGSSSSSYGSDENKTEDLEDQETKHNSVAVLSSSTLESRNQSESLNMKSSVDTKLNKKGEAKQSLSSGVFMLFISLTITVLWGKLWAIVVTSIWLYFLPVASGVAGNRRPEKFRRTRSTASCCRKRVIMEGLLERNHRRAETEH